MRPTETTQAVINGRLSLSDAPPWARPSVEFWLYRQALWVSMGVTREARRSRLAECPELWRERIESEARELYQRRRL